MSQPKPWRRLSRGPETDFTILKIRKDQVEHPKTLAHHPRVIVECNDWVNVVPVAQDGRIVLVRQFRFGVWANTLEVPGGVVERGEEPLGAAGRELEEETGYRADKLVSLGFVHPNPAFQTNRCHLALATGCAQIHGGHQDEGEDIEVVTVEREELAGLLRHGQITHALAVVALLRSGMARFDTPP